VAGLLLVAPLTPLGWRLYYLVALAPLAIAAVLRRRLREARAFERARAERRVQRRLWSRVAPRHRRRLVRILVVVGAFGLVQTSNFFYASDLAQSDYGLSRISTALILVSAFFGALGFWLGGRASDLVGRRPMVALSMALGGSGTVLVFAEVPVLFAPGFFVLATAGSCFIASSVAYIAELFPTAVRATLSAVVLAVQVAAGSVGLAALGALAGVVSTSLLMMVLGACLIPAALALRGLPETARSDLVGSGRAILPEARAPAA
jgi:MFS family permease